MDILKFIVSIAILVEYTPQQLKEFGYNIYQIIIISLLIYLARTLVEVIVIKLGIDLVDLAIKFIARKIKDLIFYIKGLIYSVRLRVDGQLVKDRVIVKNSSSRWLLNLVSRFLRNHNNTKEKIVKFFKVADDLGIFISNSIPLMPTSIPVLLYNLRQYKNPWYKFNNISFLALIAGGIIRMLIVIWLTV